jgi:hypothetical protein
MSNYRLVQTAAGAVPMVNAPRPSAPSRRSSAKPHLTELGGTGTQIQSGIIFGEEFNPELTGKEGLRTWDTMRRVEPQISSTLMMIELPIIKAEWKIAPGTPAPDDLDRASFVETCLFHLLARPWDDVIRHCLIYLWAGFMLFEPTYRFEEGRTVLNDIAPRLPRTVYKWITDPKNNDLTGVKQWVFRDGRYQYIDIPAENLILLSHRQEGQNYEGTSILRSAYKAYWYKQSLERIQAVGFEREHVGLPVIGLPEGYTDLDLKRAEKLGKNIRSHEMGYLIRPPGWEYDWLKAQGGARKGSGIQDTLYYLDRQMQQNVLAQFMSLGTTDVGSYALSNDQSRVFLMSLQTVAGYISNVFNAKIVKPLLDYNYPSTAVYPEIITQKIHAYNFMDVVTAVVNLVSSGVLPVTAELEDYIIDMLGVPMAPRNIVEATNGVTQEASQVVDPNTGKRGLPPRGTPIVDPFAPRADSKIAVPGEQKNESSGGIGFSETYRFNEVYDTPQFRRMLPRQQHIYARLAEEAGRPRSVVRLGGKPFEWVSAQPATLLATPSNHERHAALLAHRLTISETAREEPRPPWMS